MLKKITIVAALTLASTAAFADNKIGVMYIPSSDFEIDGDELDGDGFGIYGQFSVSDTSYITVEYSATEQDTTFQGVNFDTDIDQIRVGFGGLLPLSNPQLSAILHAEIVNFETAIKLSDGINSASGEEEETGLGIHAGLNYAASPQFNLYGQIGYLSIDELDGPEFKVGANLKVNEQFSLFADYRSSSFEADDGTDLDVDDIRLGAALHF